MFVAFPTLSTERLALRRLSEKDNQAIFRLRTDERINKFLDRPVPENILEASDFIVKINRGIDENNCLYWAISLRNDPALIGTVCLWNFSMDHATAEFGYELNPDFQGQGLMMEAAKCVIRYAFDEISLKRIDAVTHKGNAGSIRLLEKNNFALNPGQTDEENSSILMYSRTNDSVI